MCAWCAWWRKSGGVHSLYLHEQERRRAIPSLAANFPQSAAPFVVRTFLNSKLMLASYAAAVGALRMSPEASYTDTVYG